MAVTEFQSRILQLLAGSRIKHGESYVAGGTIRFHERRIGGAWPTVRG